MEDIAPKLMELLHSRFYAKVADDPEIRALYKRIQKGVATYADAEEYAYLVGEALSQTLGKYLSPDILPDGRMYYNIANRVLRPLLEEDHSIVSSAAAMVQSALNRKANIGIKAQSVAVNTDRIDGIINQASNAEVYNDVAADVCTSIVSYSQYVVDATIRANADFHYRSQLHPKIIRKAERGCCQWCLSLAGEYDYPDVPDDIYRRHANCRCLVLFDPADGKRKYQNVHSKEYTSADDYDKIRTRKAIGISSLISDLAQHPGRLASFTPDELLTALEKEGFEIKPLMKGSLKGIPFEAGGGFKVNFEDGGLFQYHPEDKSHHGGAYYKISTGKGGTKHYDTDGNEIPNRGKS